MRALVFSQKLESRPGQNDSALRVNETPPSILAGKETRVHSGVPETPSSCHFN